MKIAENSLHYNTIGHVIAVDVSEDDYMRDYAEHFCEWINGTVIKMSPVHDKHDKLTRYFSYLLGAYLELKPIAQLRQEPFVMRLELEGKRTNREPDLQVILDTNPNNLTPTFMNGASDIVLEVVSPESKARDYGEKFYEYEQAGINEYWIIDPLKKQVRFYRLNSMGAYVLQDIDDNIYETPLLTGLKISISTLWEANLPGPIAVGQTVQKMLE